MFSVAFPAQQTLEVQNCNASVYISFNYDSSASLGIIASKYMCMTKYSFDSLTLRGHSFTPFYETFCRNHNIAQSLSTCTDFLPSCLWKRMQEHQANTFTTQDSHHSSRVQQFCLLIDLQAEPHSCFQRKCVKATLLCDWLVTVLKRGQRIATLALTCNSVHLKKHHECIQTPMWLQ